MGPIPKFLTLIRKEPNFQNSAFSRKDYRNYLYYKFDLIFQPITPLDFGLLLNLAPSAGAVCQLKISQRRVVNVTCAKGDHIDHGQRVAGSPRAHCAASRLPALPTPKCRVLGLLERVCERNKIENEKTKRKSEIEEF